eukprot:gene28094-31735_t
MLYYLPLASPSRRGSQQRLAFLHYNTGFKKVSVVVPNLVEIRDLHFSYGKRSILSGLQMDFPRGKVVAVMGGSGSGKTTVLRLIGGQIRPSRGHVAVDGQIVHKLKTDDLYLLRRKMGMLFQHGALFTDLSVFENVAFPLREHTDLYGRIIESKTRRQAFERGAGATLIELEHELAKKKAGRAGDVAEWEHVRQLAQIKMRTELEVAQQAAQEQRQLAQQRFSHQLHMQQIQNQVAQALTIEDEAHRRAQLVRLRQSETDAQRREAELEAEHHKARFHGVALANAARKREAERVQEWQDQQQLAHQRELLRGEAVKDAENSVQVAEVNQKLEQLRREGAAADAVAQYEKLLRTIEADELRSAAGRDRE